MKSQIKTPNDAILKSFDFHIETSNKIAKLLEVITVQDEHIKLMATKLLKIEKTLAKYQMTGTQVN